jgi:uncharacterized integral membrane protein
MADPHHVPELDSFDELTVRLYRIGLSLSALALACAGLLQLLIALNVLDYTTPWVHRVWVLCLLGTAGAISNMHLYDKRIRWFIGTAGWIGAVALFTSGGPEAPWLYTAGLGFLFVALSAYALKEQFCFRIPGLRLVPLLLATALIPLLTGHPAIAGALLLCSGLIYTALVIAKWRMPLHFDVGDKSSYQI